MSLKNDLHGDLQITEIHVVDIVKQVISQKYWEFQAFLQ